MGHYSIMLRLRKEIDAVGACDTMYWLATTLKVILYSNAHINGKNPRPLSPNC